MMKHLLLTLTIILFAGCATTMLDRINRLETFDPKDQKIVINPFKFNPDIATGVNKEFVSELGNEMAMDIRSLLFERGYKDVIIEMDAVRKVQTPEQRRKSNVAKSKKYLERNGDKVNAKRREHYARNKDQINKKRRERYARMKQSH